MLLRQFFAVTFITSACREMNDSCRRMSSRLNSVAPNPGFFPMLVNLLGQKCVVVGAGTIAAAKIEGLLLCGASVVVVSPRAVLAIRDHARTGALCWRRKSFSANDVDGAFLAIAATNSCKTNEGVFRACKARGVLCNSVDDPEHCDFFYPAVVRRGALQIAISTGGHSPALASRLRRELEQQFGREWNEWLEYLGAQRRKLLNTEMPAEARKRYLTRMVTRAAFQAFMRKRSQASGARKSRQASR